MPRTVPQWIGKTDDTSVPPRVRLRIWERCGGYCMVCDRKLRPGDVWEVDHAKALIDGGENREDNLWVVCKPCHTAKTAFEVAIKSKVYRTKAKHLGIKRRKSRPIPGSKGSGFRKRMNGTVIRENK